MKFQNDFSTKARFSIFKTQHGKLKLPALMPVATKGTVKLTPHKELKKMGYQAIISNSYLLSLKPGLETIKKFKGLHSFIGWDKIIATDSGGFQVARDFLISLSDKGFFFKNPFTNQKEFLSPEKTIEIQKILQSDIAMVLDDMPLYPSTKQRAKEAVERTFLFAKRSLSHFKKINPKKPKQKLFGIVQGSVYSDLREKSIQQITSLDFDGFALGGLALNEPKKEMFKMISFASSLPEDKPRYIMGLGSWKDVLKSISLGADLFDSCYLTRVGRHGRFFTFNKKGYENIQLSKNKESRKPLDSQCNCFVCQTYSRAYLRHLLKTGEETAKLLISYHNLYFVSNLLKQVREEIKQGNFKKFISKTI